MNLQDMKSEILKNQDVLAEYEAIKLEYDIVKAVLDARKKTNLTQQQLADITGIDRADISKLENGNTNPTLGLLKRLADGMGMTLKLEFVQKNSMQ